MFFKAICVLVQSTRHVSLWSVLRSHSEQRFEVLTAVTVQSRVSEL
jgi:hypothetical protein